MIEFPFPTVFGHLAPYDKDDLRSMAQSCSVLQGDFVEIGALEGLSTLCICSGMSRSKRLTTFELTVKPILHHNIRDAGYADMVQVVPGDCQETLPRSDIKQIAFAFVDHSHMLKPTVFAYDWLWPRMVPGGILAFHDFLHEDYREPEEFFKALPHPRHIERGGMIAYVK